MIVDWLEGFLLRLAESYPPPPGPPHGWPDYGTAEWSVYFEDWRKAFARNGVSEAEAEEARALMGEDPPRFRAEYLTRTIAAVKILREINPSHAPGAKDDRESAAAASGACKHCSGQGLAIVYAPDPAKVRGVADVAAYCVCPLGRWVEGNHREKSPDVHRRSPDLAKVLAGRSCWRADPPWFGRPANRPAPEASAPPPSVRRWVEGLGKVEPAVPIPPREKWETTVEPGPAKGVTP